MYKAIVAKEYNNFDQVKVEKQSLDHLRQSLSDTNFIVKVHAAPINPRDLLKLQGGETAYKPPFTPGSEGSGVIIEATNQEFLGKKVSFITSVGSWREYALVSKDNVILLEDNADLDSAACGFINPITALGLVYVASKKYKASGIINLAAQSAIGKMINDWAIQSGLNCLNVIRGDTARVQDIINSYKNEYVITTDQDPETFEKQIKNYSQKLSLTVCFDPLGGPIVGQILNNLPPYSRVINYGSLSGKNIEGINPMDLRAHHKKLQGFAVFVWFGELSAEDKIEQKQLIRKYANTIFKTRIEQQSSFENIKSALQLFATMNSGKKIILKPDL